MYLRNAMSYESFEDRPEKLITFTTFCYFITKSINLLLIVLTLILTAVFWPPLRTA